MMNPFEFVLALLFLIFGFVILKHKLGISHRSRREDGPEPGNSREAAQLREEVKLLKDRIKVLERITVEKENSLAAEIESLRDR